MIKFGSLFLLISLSLFSTKNVAQKDEITRYILIEAPCKPSFPSLAKYDEKVVITNVFMAKFENEFELVNAEKDLVAKFEIALEKSYPNSRNHIEDIMVYVLDEQKEAKELLNRKKKLFKTLGTGVIELKVK